MKIEIEELDAIHEASHAVMAWLASASVGEVWLGGRGTSDFGGCQRTLSPTALGEARIKFAGVGGELIKAGESCWSLYFKSSGRHDWDGAQEYIDRIGGDRRRVIRDIKTSTLKHLTDHWQWVLAVAGRLREERHLLGTDVLALRPELPRLVPVE